MIKDPKLKGKWILFENNFQSSGIIMAEYFEKYQKEHKINWWTKPFSDITELETILDLDDCFEYNMYEEAKKLFRNMY